MTTLHLSGRDLRLRDAVRRQLDWDPEVDASGIGVAAADGVVTLTGACESYVHKLAAERGAKRVRGVRAVANDLVVRAMAERTDTDIARDAAHALAVRPSLAMSIQVAVHHGHVTLTGLVDWIYQKAHAEEAVAHVTGVRAVHNRIDLRARPGERDLQRRIVRALHRQADIDARRITVSVEGDSVVLSGTVTSWAERETAERAAGAAPGIRRVDNRVTVVPGEPIDEEADDFD